MAGDSDMVVLVTPSEHTVRFYFDLFWLRFTA
jgi:hypothetical protein